MSRYIQGEHKDQVSLLPMTLNEMIAEDHPVRVIDAFVDTLDMQRLGFRYGVTKEVGRQPSTRVIC
ncbi:transposase [Isachenkonia alkalipeptolytica]|uniref:Transposase n=1 Tax=Isachenkonia alkalipeptolytica TaxID=2565777 RepID=A0AA43XL63_9CLOT|nr:transposase [Isachenkonia alkalipeptolytica]NBG88855.1 transposase [Isachenkonia alkalipeptolytica]